MMWMHAAHESEVDCRVWYFRSSDARAHSVGDDVVAKHVLCGVTLRDGFFFAMAKLSNRDSIESVLHTQTRTHKHTAMWTLESETIQKKNWTHIQTSLCFDGSVHGDKWWSRKTFTLLAYSERARAHTHILRCAFSWYVIRIPIVPDW